MAFLVGPVAVEPDGWPPSWRDAAAASFPTIPARPDAIVMSSAPVGLRTDEEGRAARAEEIMQQRRDGRLWRIVSPGMFAADLDLPARRFVVRSANPEIEPELALKNPLRALLATVMPLEHDGFVLHACSGLLDGRGVAVSGLSTAGKTTLALGFRRTVYLTDDVTLVRVGDEPALLASPFFGGAGVRGVDASGPLRAIGVLVDKELDPAKRSSFQPTTRAEGCAALLRHVARFTKDPDLTRRLLELTARLVERVPVLLLRRSLQDDSDAVAAELLRLADG